ncbi:hypothetical protein BH23CHL7_BH23CHL7_17350 [soil metagenome]
MLVEADFMRDYRVDLAVDLARMSWRRFLVLLRGLSPNSATVTAHAQRSYIGKKREPVLEINDRAAAQAWFEATFKPAPKAS